MLKFVVSIVISILLFGCYADSNIEPGFYLLKQLSDPEIEGGVVLEIEADSIEVGRYGSIFTGSDYRLWFTASVGSPKTSNDSIEYSIYTSKKSGHSQVISIILPTEKVDFEMVRIGKDSLANYNLVDSIRNKKFVLLRDTSTKAHFFSPPNFAYKTPGSNPEFQNWYPTPWIDSNSIMMDGMRLSFLEIKAENGRLSLYSPFYAKTVAVEDQSNDLESLKIDSSLLGGTWTKLEKPIAKEFLHLGIKPREVKFEDGQLIRYRDTIRYYLDVNTGFMDLHHRGSLALIALSKDTIKLVGSDFGRRSYSSLSQDTFVYVK